MIRSGSSLIRDRRGVAALELALLLPVMIILLFGTIEVTQLVRISMKLDRATQQAAELVATQNSMADADIANVYVAAKLVLSPFPGTPLQLAIGSVTFSSVSKAQTIAWQVSEGGAAGLTSQTACVPAAALSTGSDSVIVVQATYAYSAVISYLLPSQRTLSYTAFARPRNVISISAPLSAKAASSC